MSVSAKNKSNSINSFMLPVATIVALIGGIGAAVLTHPKSKKVRDNLSEVTDDLVNSIEKVLDKVESGSYGRKSHGLSEVSQFVMSAYDEIRSLNDAAEDTSKSISKVIHNVKHEAELIEEKIVDKVHQAEVYVSNVDEDISEKIAWLQKKGRILAKKRN